MNTYVVTYENGATNVIQALCLEQAVLESREALLGCMPKGFNPDKLVKAVAAKQLRTKEDYETSGVDWLVGRTTCHNEPPSGTT